MHLLPASLAILPGGEVLARHTCNGAAFYPVADNVGAAECGQAAASSSRTAPGADVVRTLRPYLSRHELVRADYR